MSDDKKTKRVISKQWVNFGVLIGIAIISMVGFILLMSDHTNSSINSKNEKGNFSSPLDHVDAESVLLEKTQKQLRDTAKKTDSLQQQLNSLSNKSDSDKINQNSTEDLKKRIDILEKQLSQNKDSSIIPEQSTQQSMQGSQQYQGNLFPLPPNSKAVKDLNNGQIGQGIREDNLSFSSTDSDLNNSPMKNPDTYVPAGTFVKAVMIGGADASAAVNASSDPLVMLFRITENGTLPNNKKSHLKNCMALASVWGDISSETGQIRLVNLSCTFPNNEIVDQAVEGTVFGPQGKNGVRGTPLWRDGAITQRVFTAGFLSGVANGVSNSYNTNSISAQGTVQTLNSGKILQNGLATGSAKSMDKLSDYYIQRAEQYHPVIQLSAGTVVDLVFQKGFFLDGKKHDNKDTSIGNYGAAVNSTPMLFPDNSSSEQNLPLSPEAIKKIQEKSKELGLRVTN